LFPRGAQKAKPPSGAIFALTEELGLSPLGRGERRRLRCPLPGHADRNASAVLFGPENRFHCAVCTPGGSLSMEALAAALGMPPRVEGREPAAAPPRRPAEFLPEEARVAWELALRRARDDAASSQGEDSEVYRYLHARGLAEAWELSAFGILTGDMALPGALRSWPERGYRLVVPLYHSRGGELVNLQARALRSDVRPKTLFPEGSRAARAVFADSRGLAVLRGEGSRAAVLVGEGLTDHLCLSVHSPHAVVSAPGAGGAARALGPWVRGREVVLALDCDRAGERGAEAAAREACLQGAKVIRRVCWPPGVKDASEALERLGPARLEALLGSAG
jgi:hypothetical protein